MNTEITKETNLDVSIVMPCLNEEANVAFCIKQAQDYISSHRLSGEVIVVDNGSTDNSAAIAAEHGATVISESRRGYGRALRTGLENSRGAVVIFADCDSTYDFSELDPIYVPLANGSADVMIGNRFAGQMEDGAMPFSHKLGVPFLSFCGRLRWHVSVYDFHCGLRGLTKEALSKMTFETDGMEFATEFIAEAARKHLHVGEVSVPLRKSQKPRRAKLNTIRDGFRHLFYIFTAKPMSCK